METTKTYRIEKNRKRKNKRKVLSTGSRSGLRDFINSFISKAISSRF